MKNDYKDIDIKVDDLKLTDVIELNILQKIQDAFASSFDMPSIIYDTKGNPITQPSCFTEFCKFVRSTEKGNENCKSFDAKLIKELSQTTEPIIRNGCALKNIITATTTIKVNNIHLANFGIGQIIDTKLDKEEIINYAIEIGVKQELLLEKALTLIPSNRAKLENAIKFLAILTEQISQLGFQNLINKKLIEKQKLHETEILAEQQRTNESENKFRSYIENAPDGIIVIQNNGKYLEVNTELCKMFGYTRDEFLNNYYKIPIIAEEDYTKARKSVENILTNGRYIDEFRFKRKDGTYFNGLMSAVKISDNQTLTFIKNIDEIKQTQKELIQAKEKAEESDRLKSAFLKNISHEIRTPMNAICGFTDLLLKQNLTIDKQKQFTEIIHKSVNQLLNVVENTITISSIETNQLKFNKIDFNPNKLFLELFDDYKRLQPKIEKLHIEFKININKEHNLLINNDFTRIKQIINILLDNAFKFTNNGKIEFGYNLQNNHINFYVSDTGIGIPNDKQEIIFKSFTQANETIRQFFGGVGLGLSIAIGLIKIIGGKLTINSEENKGTKIEFSLLIEQTENSINKSDSNEQKKLENINLLVAEDEDFNFQYIEELLLETKIKIIHAINGHKAVEICKNQNINIILMDLKMPIMDGFEATTEIRKFNKTVPIIAQTAYSYKREDCINSGFTDYIAKPFNDEELIKMITQYADR